MVNFLCSLNENNLNINSDCEDFEKLINLIDMAPIYQEINVLFPPKSRLRMMGSLSSGVYRDGINLPLDIEPHIGSWKNTIQNVKVRQSNSGNDFDCIRTA